MGQNLDTFKRYYYLGYYFIFVLSRKRGVKRSSFGKEGIAVIEVKHLIKTYGAHHALNDVSFKIANGKIYGLLGPNGAGKSTTMNIMTGCLAPTSGTVRINGFDVFDKPIQAKRLIGYLPEQPPLYEDMTAMEYLAFVAEAKGVDAERVIRQVKEVLELTALTDMKDRLICNLSKGCRQRVGIAQALLGNPEIIILDEPTVGLDPKQLVEIRTLIRKLGQNHTVIISSHILAEISEICDELLVISGGCLVAQGTLSELEDLLGDGAKETEQLRIVVRGDEEGVVGVMSDILPSESWKLLPSKQGEVALSVSCSRNSDVRDRIFFAMADRHYAVIGMETEHKSLENVFLALTGEADGQKEEQ